MGPHTPPSGGDGVSPEARLQAMIQRLEVRQTYLEAENRELQSAQRAAAAAAGAAGAHTPYRTKLKPAPTYSGVGSIDEWYAVIHQQLVYYHVATAAERYNFAYGNLGGPALDYVDNLAVPLASLDALLAALRARFQPVTTADTARAKLPLLRQGKQSADAYTQAFRRLIVHLPSMHAEDVMHAYRIGLHPALQVHLLQAQPKTLDEAIVLAVRIGSAPGIVAASGTSTPMDLSVLNAEFYGSSAISAPPGDEPLTVANFSECLNALFQSRKGAPGAGGGAKRPPGPRPVPVVEGVAPDVVADRISKRLCAGCGDASHIRWMCPKRKIAADGSTYWPK